MAEDQGAAASWLDLYDWRQRVAQLYRFRMMAFHTMKFRPEQVQGGLEPGNVFQSFCRSRDALFKDHPQSPLSAEDRQAFAALRYFPYDPAYCVEATLEPEAVDLTQELEASGPHTMRFRRAARIRCTLVDAQVELVVYWIDVYGGGLFLPFRDATNSAETYGGGRYLFDTVKGSDFVRLDRQFPGEGPMGYPGGRVQLDFNYAYNPSCAYDARWICPLSPPDNRLSLPIRAGELAFHAE